MVTPVHKGLKRGLKTFCEGSEANSCVQFQLRKIHGVRQGRALRLQRTPGKVDPRLSADAFLKEVVIQ